MALPKLYDPITWHNNTTPALNEDNLNAMSQAIDDIDDRVIDLAGTIMEDVPQIIEDMAILGPAVENIDDNVARAEAAAESAEQYAEEIAPPIELVKDYADIITVEDAINKAAKDVKVKVDAVQDLHGYDKPWVGGAGKNLLPLSVDGIKECSRSGTWSGNTYSLNNTTFEIQTDSANNVTGIKINTGTGGASEQASLYICGNNSGITIPNTTGKTVTMSGLTNGCVWAYKDSSWAGPFSNKTVTVRSSDIIELWIAVPSGGVVSNVVLKPQLEVGSTATAWEPYTNICPITGHSEVKVTRAGFNILNATQKASSTTANVTYSMGADNLLSANGTASGNADLSFYISPITINAGETIHFSVFGEFTYNGNGISVYGNGYAVALGIEQLKPSRTSFAYTASETVTISSITMRVFIGEQINASLHLAIDKQPTAITAYTPYQGETYVISLNGTRYGGVLDVDTGTLTLTHQYIDLGSLDWTKNASSIISWYTSNTAIANMKHVADNVKNPMLCSCLEVTSQSNRSHEGTICEFSTNEPTATSRTLIISTALYDSAQAPATALKTAITGQTLVYELATPQTISLTAEEVTLLLGYNTLFADTGDIALTYDASGVLRIANAKLDIDTFKAVVAASSDFSDFKTRVAAL